MSIEPIRDRELGRVLQQRTPPPARPGFWAELATLVEGTTMQRLDDRQSEHRSDNQDMSDNPVMFTWRNDQRHDSHRWVMGMLVAAASLALVIGGVVAIRDSNRSDRVPGNQPPATTTVPDLTTTAPTDPSSVALRAWLGEYEWAEATPDDSGQIMVHRLVLDTLSTADLLVGRLTGQGQTTNSDVAVQAELVDGTLHVHIAPGSDPGPYTDGAALFDLSGSPDNPVTTVRELQTLTQVPAGTGDYFIPISATDSDTVPPETTAANAALAPWLGTYTALEGGAGADIGRRPVAEYQLTFTDFDADGNLEGALQRAAYEIIDETQRVDDLAASFQTGVVGLPVDNGIQVVAGTFPSGTSPFEEGLVLFTLTGTPDATTTVPGAMPPYILWDLITFAR